MDYLKGVFFPISRVQVTLQLSLLLHQEVESVFDRILSSTVKNFWNLSPLLSKLNEMIQELQILLRSPETFFEVGIHVARPMFSTLFGRSECSKTFPNDVHVLGDLRPTGLSLLLHESL